MSDGKSYPSQPEVEWAMLNLLHLSKSLSTQQTYRELADHFQLTEEQRSQTLDGEKCEEAWPNLCRFARRRLVDHGLLHGQPRGQWSITQRGEKIARLRGGKYQSITLEALEALGLWS